MIHSSKGVALKKILVVCDQLHMISHQFEKDDDQNNSQNQLLRLVMDWSEKPQDTMGE